MKTQHNILKLTFLLVCISLSFGFTNQSSEFSFFDEKGNKFTIENTKHIPKIIDVEFLKKNLNGTHFKAKLSKDSKLKFKYIITEFDKIKRLEYRIQIRKIPISKKVEDILMYLGVSHYKMKLKKTKNGIELETVEFLYSEI